MRPSPHPTGGSNPFSRRWSTKKILIVTCGSLYAAYLLFLGVSTVASNVHAAQLSTDIQQTKASIDNIYKNANFALYSENKAFLDGMIIPRFSVYLDDLGTRIPEGTSTQSIQITRSTEDQAETYELGLILESVPPLHEVGKVIDTLAGSQFFKDVTISSASVNTTSAGTTTFSYPISMTLNPNGNTNAAAPAAATK